MSTNRGAQLVKFLLPTIISNCCFFLFTIVDGIFVGRYVGDDALGAVNFVLPFIMIINALFMLCIIGGVTVTAIRLGRGDLDGANQAFMHAFTLVSVVSVVISLLGIFFTNTISTLLGANETFRPLTNEYLFWYSIFIIPSGISMLCQSFTRNDGSPILVGIAVVISSLLNIFGDWLLVAYFDMGLKGAAIATGISQVVLLIIVLFHFILKKGNLRIKGYKPKGTLFGKILIRGLPEMLAQFASPINIICMNNVLLKYMGDSAVNAYSMIGYVASFSVAFFFGAAAGLQPLFGQSYGTMDEKGLKYYLKAGIIVSVVSSIIIYLSLFVLATPVCKMFSVSNDTLNLTLSAMPKYAWSFIITAFNTILTAFFYSTKHTKQAIILSIMRSFLFNTLTILIAPIIFGSVIIWFTVGVAESLAMILGIILLATTKFIPKKQPLPFEQGDLTKIK